MIIRPGAIGDTLLTFPALTALRARFPTASIEVVGNRLTLDLARATGLIDRVDAFGADWVSDVFGDEPTPALRARLAGIDLGIVWMHALEAASDFAERLKRAGVGATLPATSFPVSGSGQHVADQLLASLAPLGVGQTLPMARLGGPSVALPGNPEGADRLAILQPGAGGRRKRWPAERFAALADRLILAGYSVALTSGPSDDGVAEAVRAAVSGGPIQILAEKSLVELASIFARARVFIGNDSGITHLAALVGAPTVALFGPFDPAYWAPIGPRVAVVDAGRSCAHRADPREGCRVCDLMPSLAVETVWNAVEELVGCLSPRPNPLSC